FSPFSASRVRVGVLQGPPNVLVAPKPTSSSSTRRMFGAPAGAFTGCGKSDFESLARRLMVPRNGWGGLGSTSPPAGGWVATLGWPALSWPRASLPDAASQPNRAPAASTAAAVTVGRARMVSSPVVEAKGWEVQGIVLSRGRADGLARQPAVGETGSECNSRGAVRERWRHERVRQQHR